VPGPPPLPPLAYPSWLNTPLVAVAAATPAGEVKIDEKATDPVNAALAAMKNGTAMEKNTQKRIAAGTHKIAYLEDIATDPKSDEILKKMGLDPKQFTIKIDPWTGGKMAVQNNAVGFAIGSNLVGSKTADAERWKSLMCHEVNHLVNNDNATKPDSVERYKGEFRAYFLAEYSSVKDEAQRAKDVRAHILRDYPALKNKYDTDADFKKQIDAHAKPDATDNLDNH
jgi:hypothetical protein